MILKLLKKNCKEAKKFFKSLTCVFRKPTGTLDQDLFETQWCSWEQAALCWTDEELISVHQMEENLYLNRDSVCSWRPPSNVLLQMLKKEKLTWKHLLLHFRSIQTFLDLKVLKDFLSCVHNRIKCHVSGFYWPGLNLTQRNHDTNTNNKKEIHQRIKIQVVHQLTRVEKTFRKQHFNQPRRLNERWFCFINEQKSCRLISGSVGRVLKGFESLSVHSVSAEQQEHSFLCQDRFCSKILKLWRTGVIW